MACECVRERVLTPAKCTVCALDGVDFSESGSCCWKVIMDSRTPSSFWAPAEEMSLWEAWVWVWNDVHVLPPPYVTWQRLSSRWAVDRPACVRRRVEGWRGDWKLLPGDSRAARNQRHHEVLTCLSGFRESGGPSRGKRTRGGSLRMKNNSCFPLIGHACVCVCAQLKLVFVSDWWKNLNVQLLSSLDSEISVCVGWGGGGDTPWNPGCIA